MLIVAKVILAFVIQNNVLNARMEDIPMEAMLLNVPIYVQRGFTAQQVKKVSHVEQASTMMF